MRQTGSDGSGENEMHPAATGVFPAAKNVSETGNRPAEEKPSFKAARVLFDKSRFLLISGIAIALLVTIFAFLPNGFQKGWKLGVSGAAEICFSEEAVLLSPGGTYQLAAAVLPQEDSDISLTYESTDPELVLVSEDGIVTAASHWSPELPDEAEILVKADNGASASLPVAIKEMDPVGGIDYSLMYADMLVTVHVRKQGASHWSDTITVGAGDTVDVLIRCENAAGRSLDSVLVRALLPKNADYIEGSTEVTGADYPAGTALSTDALTGAGLETGSYQPGVDSLVRFQITITDKGLSRGKTTQYLWGQTQTGYITRQAYACIIIE